MVQGLLALALVACAGVADWLLGPDVPLTLGYLAPIAVAAWYFGRWMALVCTVLAATTWLGIEIFEHDLDLHPGIHFLNFSLQFALFLLFGRLLATLRQRMQREQQLALTDTLTGLANRRAFWERLEQEVRRCRRFGTPFAVAYIDVDEFKAVNDRCGHDRGDQVLERIAGVLRASIRELDLAARVGGDEFAVLFPGTAGLGATVATAKLAGVLSGAALNPGFALTCSIGCLSVLTAPASVDEIVSRADALMYAAKRLGGGQVRHETIGDAPATAAEAARRAAR